MAKYILVKENMEQQTDDEYLKKELLEKGYELSEKAVKMKDSPTIEEKNFVLETALEESQNRIVELEKLFMESEDRNKELERQLKESKKETVEPVENKKK